MYTRSSANIIRTNSNSATRVRREDLAREAEAQADGNPARRHGGVDGTEDEDAAAARAALDAYMKDTLGLQFDVPQPRPKLSKPVASYADNNENENDDNDDNDDGDEDDGSDEAMDSSDDDETQQGLKKDRKSKCQRSKKDASTTQKTSGATEFAFRLFSGSGKVAAPAQNTDNIFAPKASTDAVATPAPIVLLDDGDGAELPGPGGLLNPPRPLSFYLAGEPSAEALARYARITVSGEYVVNASRRNRAWGWEVPWRARTVVQAPSKTAMRALLANTLAPDAVEALPENLALAFASATNALPSWAPSQSPEPANPLPLLRQPADTLATKRLRPSKRRRIILRKREQARREKAAEAAALAQSKEEHLSEKKKRLNRVKKLRRREKRRAAKGEEGGDDGDDSGNDSDDV